MEDKIFRYSIKAIIIRDGKLLAESCDYGRGRFCKLPGGGHQWGETMEQALIRECKEELSLDVKPQRLVLVRDYIAKNHHSPLDEPCFHQAELMFECEVEDFSPLRGRLFNPPAYSRLPAAGSQTPFFGSSSCLYLIP